MSRAINLAMTHDDVVRCCRDLHVSISHIEPLPDGGVRVVCSSVGGADQMRAKLKRHILQDDVRRERFRPRTPLW